MRIAYVDTSYLLGIAFGEPGAPRLARRLHEFDTLVAANLLDAEFRSAHSREKAAVNEELLARLSWILPDRPIHPEIARVLECGYLRGANCWHLAVALYMAEEPSTLSFLTLDQQQARTAGVLGFAGG